MIIEEAREESIVDGCHKFQEEISFSIVFVLLFVSVEREMNCLKVMARRKSLYLLELTYLGYKRKQKVYFRRLMGELYLREQSYFSQANKKMKMFKGNVEFIENISIVR